MKLIRKRILPLLLMALLLIAALPAAQVMLRQAAIPSVFPGILPIRLPPFCSARRRTAITAPLRST